MKIKKHFTVAIITVLFAVQVHSQGIYLNAGAGYGLSAAPDFKYSDDVIEAQNGNITTFNIKLLKGSGSLGKGIQGGIVFGYMFTENIGAEINVSYLSGSKIKYNFVYHGPDDTLIGASAITGKMLRFTPAIRFTAGTGKLKPYVYTGLVIGVCAKLKNVASDMEIQNGISSLEEREWESSGRPSLGFACGLGADYKLSKNFSIFVEIGVIAQSWAPKKEILTKDSEKGIDKLPSMTTYDKETEFVDSYTSTLPNPNTSLPSQQLKTYYPFSSVGINVGVHMTLIGKN